MKKYFYSDGKKERGPFTLEKLQREKITRETKVWFQELGEWKPAAEVSEMNDLFKLVPPPISEKISSKVTAVSTDQRPPKTWLVESILVTLFCCLPFGIAAIVNASGVESRFYAGDFEGAKRYSKRAKYWLLWSFWISIIGVILYLAFFVGLGVLSEI